MENVIDKFSVKNLLFTKAIPNHEVSVPDKGHKIYTCTDCGDKFLIESSYEDHINRKSVLITYMCRHCGSTKVFYNRCKLLSHIRSHSFKTATINVNDLKVEPVPLGLYKRPANTPSTTTKVNQPAAETSKKPPTICYECKQSLPTVGFVYKDLAAHFMQYTNQVYSCPVCLFTLPTLCGLRAHLRFHLKYPPYFCPECGVNIVNKNVHYPFNHDCEGFKMMRATARLKCPLPECQLYHPNDFKNHMKNNHIKKVYKCPVCVVACFNELTMQKHLKNHNSNMNADCKSLIFFQCEMCPGRLVLQNHIENHLRTHVNNSVFPCWTCGTVFKDVFGLVNHHVKKHGHVFDVINTALTSIIHESDNQSARPKRIYRVVKRCDQCKRNFTYKCTYDEISVLPNECPYKCTSKLRSSYVSDATQSQLKCHMCGLKMPCNWANIKEHYASAHKDHRCLEPKIVIEKMDMDKYMRQKQKKIVKRTGRKRRQQIIKNKDKQPENIEPTPQGHNCSMCGQYCENRKMLELHLISHRDPCMAYQCLECGLSFVVKPSFERHLRLEHDINDVEEYIKHKQCYNENALDKYQNNDVPLEPLKENQCTICRDQFDSAEVLEKHFRVHGMAFLLKNNLNKISENASNEKEIINVED